MVIFNELQSHLHPIVVHFPIALICIGVLYDLWTAIRKKGIAPTQGLFLWFFAALGTMVAVWSGPDQDARGITTLIHKHSQFADLTMWVTILVVVIRLVLWLRKAEKIRSIGLAGYLIVSCVAAVLVLTTGYYGGQMVYTQGIGVHVNGKAVNPPKAFHFHKGSTNQNGSGSTGGTSQ